LKDLIQKVLHHPDFDPGQVDHDMHETRRLMRAIEEEDILIWDKWEEGNGRNDCSFYQRPLKKVLEVLLSDRLLEGHQHFWFESKYDSKGDRILGSDANCTLSFQLAQLCIGPDKVPVSIVLYIDKTFMRRGIPIHPVYCKLSYTISHTISYTISHTIFISQMFISFFSAFWHLPLVAVGSQNNDIHVMSKSYAWAPGGAQTAPWAPGGILSSRRDPIRIGLFMISGFWYDDFLSAVTTSTCK